MCKINKGFASDGKGRIVNTVPSQSAEEQINILLPFCFKEKEVFLSDSH